MLAARIGAPWPRSGLAATLVAIVVLTVGCGAGTVTPSVPATCPTVSTGPSAATDVPTPATEPSPPVAPASPAVAPPEATLAVEGGDPVVGQLGTFEWGRGGSDGPWLPGAPIRAGTGEDLHLTLRPDTPVTAWTGLLAPSASPGGIGATSIGDGSVPIGITVPGRGSWTLAVTIRSDGRGSATYFWRLTVP